MITCHGAFELFPGVFTQGECGSADEHDRHDFDPTVLICPGKRGVFEADCGAAEPHEEHPYSTQSIR